MGSCERYHAYLRNVYREIRAEHPTLDKESALAMAVAAVNQTAGPGGLTPTLLVFGVIPRMPIAPLKLPSHQARSAALLTARKEMVAQVARTRVRTALSAPVPAVADRDVRPGTEVLVYREPPVNAWQGPYTVIVQTDKTVSVAADGQLKTFGIEKVKAYRTPSADTAAAAPNSTPDWTTPPTAAPGAESGPATAAHGPATSPPVIDAPPQPGDHGDLPKDGA